MLWLYVFLCMIVCVFMYTGVHAHVCSGYVPVCLFIRERCICVCECVLVYMCLCVCLCVCVFLAESLVKD